MISLCGRIPVQIERIQQSLSFFFFLSFTTPYKSACLLTWLKSMTGPNVRRSRKNKQSNGQLREDDETRRPTIASAFLLLMWIKRWRFQLSAKVDFFRHQEFMKRMLIPFFYVFIVFFFFPKTKITCFSQTNHRGRYVLTQCCDSRDFVSVGFFITTK